MTSFASILTTLPWKLPKTVQSSLEPLAGAYRFLRQVYYDRLNERVEKTPSRVELLVDSSSYLGMNLASAAFEPRLISHFGSFTSIANGTFVDVGVNIGFYNLLFRWPNATAHLDAFEPLPRNLEPFQEEMKLNEATDVDIHQAALGAESGPTELSASSRSQAKASMGRGKYSGESGSATVEVSVGSTDTFCQDRTAPSLVKTDIKGVEGLMITDRSEVLSSTPDLSFSLHPTLLSDFGYTLDKVVDLLSETRYTGALWIKQNVRTSLNVVKTRPPLDTTHLHIS